MLDRTPQSRTLSLRLPDKLATDLKRAATQEANTPSAVARRLIAAGLLREQRAHELDADERR
jgi:predicted transcriptional regulator